MSKTHIDIVFDGPPNNPAPRFVEVEDASGESIKLGKWVERRDGYWVLRIDQNTGLPSPLLPATVLEGLKCEEASVHSRETFIPCGALAAAVVWHHRDKRAYLMCPMCAWHNVKNRGGRLLMATDAAAIP